MKFLFHRFHIKTPRFSSVEAWESFLFAATAKQKDLNFTDWGDEVERHERFEHEVRGLGRDFRAESKSLGEVNVDRSVFFGSARGNELALIRYLELSHSLERLPAKTSPITTMHSLARFLAEEVRTQAAAHFVSATCTSSLAALEQALSSLQAGRSRTAIVGAGEVTGSEFLHKSLRSAGLMARHLSAASLSYEPLRTRQPKQSGGLVLGDGMGLGLLQTLNGSRSEDGDGLIVLDAVSSREHGSTPTGLSKGAPHLQEAIRRLLDRNGLNTDDIKYIFAHGAGTQKGDAEELTAYRDVFNGNVAVHSCRWSLGHQLGASGFFSLVFAHLCFKNKRVPPMPYQSLLPQGIGHPCEVDKRNAKSLVVSLGFGGLVSVVLVEPEGHR